MKVFYTKEDLLQLTSEEIMDIISITSLDGRVIFLEDVVIIEPEFLIMKEGMDNISITGPDSLRVVTEKLMRFKTLKLLGTIDVLKEKNLLEELIKTRLDTIDINMQHHLTNVLYNSDQNFIKSSEQISKGMNNINTNINSQIVSISDNLTNKIMGSILPEVQKLQETTDNLAKTIAEISENISNINFTKITRVTNSLENISKLLAEVIED